MIGEMTPSCVQLSEPKRLSFVDPQVEASQVWLCEPASIERPLAQADSGPTSVSAMSAMNAIRSIVIELPNEGWVRDPITTAKVNEACSYKSIPHELSLIHI